MGCSILSQQKDLHIENFIEDVLVVVVFVAVIDVVVIVVVVVFVVRVVVVEVELIDPLRYIPSPRFGHQS